MSSTQAGVFDFQTRPGNPTPRLNSICSVAVLNSFKSVALPAQTESHSSAVRSLFGSQAAPNCHPVFSQTWRRTIFNAAEIGRRCDIPRNRLHQAELLFALLAHLFGALSWVSYCSVTAHKLQASN